MFKNYMEKYMAKFRKTKVYGVTDCKKKINKDIVESYVVFAKTMGIYGR